MINKGVALRCRRCDHRWKYKGKKPYASCPVCKTTVKTPYYDIYKEKKWKK